ncbi:ArnT family glycosyltransferase [Paenibacillus silagei]|uniref:4-amino-4-deoxy-L-arabinose transferase-like glycosyltransferase n=1 Tax=Paenibacillus silagei TaxID=1670801 RepID=A0ABS4NZZ3_9BACL|nr:glycosyltransferase family 39 protein [Paenibacillus silagei]MBP2115041.1 4-amino-4-deoxy-L-arabinose transferase-like glycosyltransferase [Paenibacillus silagei]
MKILKRPGTDVVLVMIMLLAAVLYGYGIWNDQYANTYYTTAVGSMLQSFHNFFFASLDSAGSVTVDKPPVTFWLQTLSALVFGLHGWSVILPQVLGGVGSVLLVYLLVKPTFGQAAARLAALVMAATPVAAAVSRTNNIDALLVFTLLLAAWFLFSGTRTHRPGSLLAAFGLIGVAFNEKMLQAYMVLPAFYLFYLLAAQVNWKKKTGTLAACTAVLLAVSLSWAVIVDSIPADKRPYIGSSGTNSVLNLAFGYNGVSRLTGDRSTGGAGSGGFGGGGMPGMNGMNGEMPDFSGEFPPMDGTGGQGGADGQGTMNGRDSAAGDNQSRDSGGTAPGQDGRGGGMVPGGQDGGRRGEGADGGFGGFGSPNGRGGMNGGMFNTGTAGPLRLFQQELSGQASWLLPFVLFGSIGILASLRRRSFTRQHKEALFWLAWLVPVMGFFSIAGFFHQYYLIMMAPPVAALAGAGWSQLWSYYKERQTWLSWLLPAAVLATTVLEVYIIRPYNDTIGSGWSVGILAAGIAMTVVLIILRLLKAVRTKHSWLHAAAAAGFLVLMIGPIYWAFTPIVYGNNSMTPAAGPDSGSPFGMGAMGNMPNIANMPDIANMGGMGGRNNAAGINESLLTYLKEHNTGEKYLFAAMDYGTAGPYIIDEGEQVVILNGFNASDTPYTPATLKELVESGQVKYFLVTSGGMGGMRGGGSSEITEWITANGTEVPAADWQGTQNSGNAGTLYEITLN